MLEKTTLLLTGFYGFIILYIISYRFKNNRNTNLYFIIFMFLGNIRFLAHGLSHQIPIISQFLKQIDLVFVVNAWPLLYLYFKKIAINSYNQRSLNLYHFVAPVVILILFFNGENFTNEGYVNVSKIVFVFCVFMNLAYVIGSYRLLRSNVWKRNSDLHIINKQNNNVKQWSKILFALFVLMLFRFFTNLVINNDSDWYINDNNDLWIGALVWIAMYIKISISPEFLYVYEVFENKIIEFKNHTITFDNVWITKTTKEITNSRDLILNKKIGPNVENYILMIEELALSSNPFLNTVFKPKDLATKLGIPKSHVLYVFKYHSAVTYADFKKVIRIHKSIQLIKEGYLKSNTMESLSEKTGFVSYSNFYKSFKLTTGISPQEYIRKQSTLT